MCDLNGPFKLCSCSEEVDYSKPHWILRMNNTNEGEYAMINVGMMISPNLIHKIERRKILRRLNTINVFDFEYAPNENDQLELNCQEEDGYKFTFRKRKWILEEWLGEHPIFKHKDKMKGVIESKNSKLKEVYKRYLDVLEKNERDIVDCGWSKYRMSEKSVLSHLM